MEEYKQQQRKPSGTLAAAESPEEQAERDERLNAMQWESLGSSRRDHISKADFRENRENPNIRTLEKYRRANQPGTEEWRVAREREDDLSKWSTAWKDLHDDGTAEEDLEDIAGGQTHRIKLAEAEAAAREKGDTSFEDPKNRHKGGYSAARGDRARDGGVIGTRGDDGRRASVKEVAARPESAPVGPSETVGARTRNAIRNNSGRNKLVKTANPVSTTTSTSNSIPSASGQTARGSMINISSREQPSTSANRQVPTRRQRPSPSNYEVFLAAPETFIATYQSRLIGRQAVAGEDVSLFDGHAPDTLSDVPRTALQEVVEPNAASSGERRATRESRVRSPTSQASSSVVFSTEIDSAPVGLRVPTPPPPGATITESSSEGTYLRDLMGLEWQEGVPAASYKNADESPNVASEDVEILNRPHSDQAGPSSSVLIQLALLLPSIRHELDPSVVAQLEALAARGLERSQNAVPDRQTPHLIPPSRDRASSKPDTASMTSVSLSDSRFSLTTASSDRVSAGPLTGHVDGLRTPWTRNVEAGDYEAAEDSHVIFGEHVYRSAATAKCSIARVNPTASRATFSNPFSPVPEPALQRMPQIQSVDRPSPLSNPFLGTLEQAGHRNPQARPLGISLGNSYTEAGDPPQAHPGSATEISDVLSSTSTERAVSPIAPEDLSSRDRLSSHMPAMLGPETKEVAEPVLLGSPPLEGNLSHSVHASGGDASAHQQGFTVRAHTSLSDHIIGEHLLPNSQRHTVGEGPSHNVGAPNIAAHTRFTSLEVHTRFGSPGTFGTIQSTATTTLTVDNPPGPPTLHLGRLSLGMDNSEKAAGHRGAEEGTVSGPHIVGSSKPSVTTNAAASPSVPPIQTMPSVAPVRNESSQGGTADTADQAIRASYLASNWDSVGDLPAASAPSRITSSETATSRARDGNAGRGLGGYLRQQALQLPAFLAYNPASSSDPGAAAARQYGLDRPRSPISSGSRRERDDPVSGDRVDLQASIFAAPYTGPPPSNRPTINSSGLLKPSDDVNPLRALRSKKDPWDVYRKHGSVS